MKEYKKKVEDNPEPWISEKAKDILRLSALTAVTSVNPSLWPFVGVMWAIKLSSDSD